MDEYQEFEEGTVGKCTWCKQIGEYVLDPYALDVWNDRDWMFLCESCYQERVWDI